jgi:hypothetical protein
MARQLRPLSLLRAFQKSCLTHPSSPTAISVPSLVLLTDSPPATASASPSPTSPLPPPVSCLRSTSTVSGSRCTMPNLIKRLGRRSQFLPP